MAIKMKLFEVNNEEGIPVGAGGYIMGDGKLPPDFDPDAFMAKFSTKVIMRMMRAQAQGQPIPLDIQNEIETKLHEEMTASIARGQSVEIDDIKELEV